MSFTISTDVVCDKCGNWTEGTTGTKIRKRTARSVASAYGWQTKLCEGAILVDLCPKCAQEQA